MDFEHLRTIAQPLHWGLLGAVMVLIVFKITNRQLAGFSRANIFGVLAVTEWLLALVLFIKATDEPPVERGIDLMLALLWFVNGVFDYRLWKKHDDDDGPPKKRLRTWVRSRMPRPLRPVPVKG